MAETIYWHPTQQCPIVYINGHHDWSNGTGGRAAFATCWGLGDWRNHHDFIEGTQSSMRAELTGLLNAVALAVREKIPKIVFICKDEKLIKALEGWENASDNIRKNLPHADVLLKIFKLLDDAKNYIYFLANPVGMQNAGMSYIIDIAKTEAKRDREDYVFHPTPPGLPVRPGTEPVVIPEPVKLRSLRCFIIGICMEEGQAGARAAYAIYFHNGDPRNAAGRIENPQTSYRGELIALKAALIVANATGEPTHLHVTTRSAALKSFTDNFAKAIYMTNTSKLQGGLPGECRLLADKIARLTVELIPPKTNNPLLEVVNKMARAVFESEPARVSQSQIQAPIKTQKKAKMPSTTVSSDFDSSIYERLDAIVIHENTPCKIPVTCRTIEVQPNRKAIEKEEVEDKKVDPKPNGGPPATFGRQTPSTSYAPTTSLGSSSNRRNDADLVVRVDHHQENMFDGFRPRFGRTLSTKYPFV